MEKDLDRDALGLHVSGEDAARIFTEARALELAHAYLHDTAVKLYEGKVH